MNKEYQSQPVELNTLSLVEYIEAHPEVLSADYQCWYTAPGGTEREATTARLDVKFNDGTSTWISSPQRTGGDFRKDDATQAMFAKLSWMVWKRYYQLNYGQ